MKDTFIIILLLTSALELATASDESKPQSAERLEKVGRDIVFTNQMGIVISVDKPLQMISICPEGANPTAFSIGHDTQFFKDKSPARVDEAVPYQRVRYDYRQHGEDRIKLTLLQVLPNPRPSEDRLLPDSTLPGIFQSVPHIPEVKDLAMLEDLAIFRTTISIEVTELSYDRTNRVTITNPAEVSRIVGTIQLKPHFACSCLHLRTINFRTQNGELHASFCDHCFDIGGSGGGESTRFYQMPAELYAEMVQQLQKAAAKN